MGQIFNVAGQRQTASINLATIRRSSNPVKFQHVSKVARPVFRRALIWAGSDGRVVN